MIPDTKSLILASLSLAYSLHRPPILWAPSTVSKRPFSLQRHKSPPQSSLSPRLLEETCLGETLVARGLGRAPPCLQHVCQPLRHHTVFSRKHCPPTPFHTILSQFTTEDPWCLGCCFRRLDGCPMLGFEVDFARAQEARPSDIRQRPEVILKRLLCRFSALCLPVFRDPLLRSLPMLFSSLPLSLFREIPN